MMQTNKIGQVTELQIVSGGGWITASYPTNFHQFFKRKMLTATESPEDFREVTDAEKATIEAADEAWVRPPQSFIDQWNEAAGQYGCYNEQTGFFELNGLTDITYSEAIEIHATYYGKCIENAVVERLGSNLKMRSQRTFFPRYFDGGVNYTEALRNCDKLVVAPPMIGVMHNTGWTGRQNLNFNQCTKLEIVSGEIGVGAVSQFDRTFTKCDSLREIRLSNIKVSVSFEHSPKISIDSLKYTITKATNTSTITITVHPDIYAKLTDETNTEWHQVLIDAAAKNIQFATTTT